jgi:adenine/guanine/hypoxanthine permease
MSINRKVKIALIILFSRRSFMDKYFRLKENGTSAKTEIIAGITTFMTMAYILVVNPSILSDTGMNFGAVFTATALSSLIATALTGLCLL